MLIPLIFRGGEREREVCPDAQRECPQCGSAEYFTIYEVWREFGVWPFKNAEWNRRYATKCNRCGTRYKSSYDPTQPR